MLRSIKDLVGYPIHATDGDIGKVADCLFDDREWGLRYLVVNTGGWLNERKVLVSPMDIDQPEVGWFGRHVPVKLTKEQIKNSPPLDSDQPLSQRYEQEYARYHQHPLYWEGPSMWGGAPSPRAELPPSPEEEAEHETRLENIRGRRVRSTNKVLGYDVESADGPIGHVEDLILQTNNWRLRYLVIDTRNLLPGKNVLVDIDWVWSFDWSRGQADVNLTKDRIRHSPVYHPSDPVNRVYETELYDYYGKPRYWEEPAAPVM